MFVNNKINIAFYDMCFINLKTDKKYSLKYQHCEISMGQIGYIVLFFAKFWINCLNIKSDVPVNNLHKSLTYLKKC